MNEMSPRPPPQPETIDLGSLEPPVTVDRRDDHIRENIAYKLTYAVIGIVVLPILSTVIFPSAAAAIKELAVAIIPSVIGIYGTIIGFYFGQKK